MATRKKRVSPLADVQWEVFNQTNALKAGRAKFAYSGQKYYRTSFDINSKLIAGATRKNLKLLIENGFKFANIVVVPVIANTGIYARRNQGPRYSYYFLGKDNDKNKVLYARREFKSVGAGYTRLYWPDQQKNNWVNLKSFLSELVLQNDLGPNDVIHRNHSFQFDNANETPALILYKQRNEYTSPQIKNAIAEWDIQNNPPILDIPMKIYAVWNKIFANRYSYLKFLYKDMQNIDDLSDEDFTAIISNTDDPEKAQALQDAFADRF